jgi:hypothetical protein
MINPNDFLKNMIFLVDIPENIELKIITDINDLSFSFSSFNRDSLSINRLLKFSSIIE